ncbi:MAG: sigma-70 family RNA polymerase sigma factor [Planctomycetes bacterium]|nr:sigma-70 family RNA polymerase sigma factor [Planctomycetota bacterium]
MSESERFHALIEAACRGEREARDEIFQRFYPSVRSMVHRALEKDLRAKKPWLASAFSTGDVVQDVFLCVLRDLDDVEGRTEAAFASYLAALVKNRLIDAVRFHEAVRRDVRRARGELDAELLTRGSKGPGEKASAQEEVDAFLTTVATLSGRERLLLRERLESETSFVDIATLLGYPSADAARKAFYAAQAKLIMGLRSRGVRAGEDHR